MYINTTTTPTPRLPTITPLSSSSSSTTTHVPTTTPPPPTTTPPLPVCTYNILVDEPTAISWSMDEEGYVCMYVWMDGWN